MKCPYCNNEMEQGIIQSPQELSRKRGTNSTFDNDYMTGETTVRYYNEDVWEELVDAVAFDEAIAMLEE